MNNTDISQGLKVTGWIINGTPSKYGNEVANKRVVPMRSMQFHYLHRIWRKLKEPLMFYHESDASIEFSRK